MAESKRDVATIANCLLCDSYFVLVVDVVPGAQYFRGRDGTKLLEDTLEQLQDAHCARTAGIAGTALRLLPCPTCAELLHQKPWKEFIGCVEDVAALAPGVFVEFEGEPAPLYMDANAQAGGAFKWKLCQGLGPQALELDKSKSGRIYKPTLRQVGIEMRSFERERHSKHEYERILDLACEQVMHTEKEADAQALLEEWRQQRPVYMNWDSLAEQLEGLHLERQAEQKAHQAMANPRAKKVKS